MVNITAIELLERMVQKGSFLSPADFNEAWHILKDANSPVVVGQQTTIARTKLTVIEGSGPTPK